MSKHTLDITTLKNGAAIEMINKELQTMVNDVADINKEAKSKRKLTMDITLLPTDDGGFGACVIEVKSTLGKQKPEQTSLSFGFEDGQGIASEKLDIRQHNVFEMSN